MKRVAKQGAVIDASAVSVPRKYELAVRDIVYVGSSWSVESTEGTGHSSLFATQHILNLSQDEMRGKILKASGREMGRIVGFVSDSETGHASHIILENADLPKLRE